MWDEVLEEEEMVISHIIKTMSEDPSKGNLYLSGIVPLAKPGSLAELDISCVLTIMDQWCFRDYEIRQKIQSQGIT